MPRPLSSHTKRSGRGRPWYEICADVFSATWAVAWFSEASPKEHITIASAPRARDAQACRTIDRERHPDGTRKMRRDRGRHRQNCELLAPEDLVSPAGDRLGGRGDHPEHESRSPSISACDGARGRTRPTGSAGAPDRPPAGRALPRRSPRARPSRSCRSSARVAGASGRRSRLACCRPERARSPPPRAEPRATTRSARALSGPRGDAPRADLAPKRRPAAPTRRSTRPRRPARSCGRGARTRPAPPRRSPARRPMPGAPIAAARGRTRTRAPRPADPVDRVEVLGRLHLGLAAGEEDDAGDRGRYDALEAVDGCLCDLRGGRLVGAALSGDDHVRLEQRALKIDADS